MNEKTKNILKILEIWYIVRFILCIIWCLCVGHNNLLNIKDFLGSLLFCILEPICLLVFTALAFLPAIIVLYFLFKKIKNINLRIILIAFIIPFTNLIYYIIEHFLIDFEIFSMIIGFYTLFVFLPTALIVTLCAPKSILPFKKEFIKANILMGIIGWILICLSSFITDFIEWKIELNILNKYQPVIETIEQYKSENGLYPQNIDDNIKLFKNFNYEPQDNNNGFILELSNHWEKSYNYCSDSEYQHCKEGWYSGGAHKKIGNWIKADYSD